MCAWSLDFSVILFQAQQLSNEDEIKDILEEEENKTKQNLTEKKMLGSQVGLDYYALTQPQKRVLAIMGSA